MMKIKSFLAGILFLITVFIMVVLTALIYRANERSKIKTYLFQMGNNVNERVGDLQNINNISQNDLRNKLIKTYISEYFKVIPGDQYVTTRPVLSSLSDSSVFEQWKSGTAQQILEMSNKKMFRMAKVTSIEVLNNSKDNIDYANQTTAEHIYYVVNYDTYTWAQSNDMNTEPMVNSGVIVMEARFKPGLQSKDRYGKKINVKKYLESGKSPIGLFMFEVTKIGSKGIE